MKPASLACGFALSVGLAYVFMGFRSILIESLTRSGVPERHNLSPEEGNYTLADHEALVKFLGILNGLDPTGHPATLAAFEALASGEGGVPRSILEVGPGSGGLARMLAAKYPNSSVLGIDANNFSVNIARKSGEMLPNLAFELRSSSELSEAPGSVDVLTTTFVNHEIFPDEDFVEFLRRVRTVGRRAMIFNDWVRSFGCICYMDLVKKMIGFAGMLSLDVHLWIPGLTQNFEEAFLGFSPAVLDFILDAGVKSARKSFTMAEYKAVFQEAGYPEDALQCSRGEGFYLQDFIGLTCRVTCTADLTMPSPAVTSV